MAINSIYNRKNFKRDVVFILLILVTPFLVYIYLLFPEYTKIYKSALFTIESNYYENVQILIHQSSMKMIFILMYIYWFLTCKHWWRMVLLIPIVFNFYQFLQVINDDVLYVDKYEFWFCLLLSTPLIVFLFYVSKRLNYYSKHQSLNESLNKEISQLIHEASHHGSPDFKVIKNKLLVLRKEKSNLSKVMYLSKLIELRDKLN